ncbi:MAG: hypothetical protein ABI789_14810, partial [Usitatibacter sp.]
MNRDPEITGRHSEALANLPCLVSFQLAEDVGARVSLWHPLEGTADGGERLARRDDSGGIPAKVDFFARILRRSRLDGLVQVMWVAGRGNVLAIARHRTDVVGDLV